MNYYIYAIECVTPNHIYIGQTGRLADRMMHHRTGTGCKFTKVHKVKNWVVLEIVQGYREALIREQDWIGDVQRLGCYVIGGTSPPPLWVRAVRKERDSSVLIE